MPVFSYLAEPSDMALCIMGVRLMMRIARTKPFVDSLDLPKDSNDKTSLFWPTDCNPDTVRDSIAFFRGGMADPLKGF